MPFWSQAFGEDAELKDPKRNFRFTVSITGIAAANGGPLLWYANSVTKPTFTLSSAEHKYLNHTFYYPGNVTWMLLLLWLGFFKAADIKFLRMPHLTA